MKMRGQMIFRISCRPVECAIITSEPIRWKHSGATSRKFRESCERCRAMIAAKAFDIPCPTIWNRFPRGTAALCGFEVIEDETPDVTEVVEKYGEDAKRKLTRADILHAAEKCVCGQREQDYGTPEDNFKTIAELWEAYLNKACTRGVNVRVEAKDVAAMMALLKIARIAAGGGKADSWIDLAGYAACGAECEGVTE